MAYPAPQDHSLIETGPKQSRKPISAEQQDVTPKIPRFDPKALLNPRSAPTSSAASSVANGGPAILPQSNGTPLAEADGAEVHHGMSSMIERMHNVSNRDSVPTRKRKSEAQPDQDEAPEQKKAKSTFNGATAGGPLTQHMKAERENIVAKNGPSTAPIDLTGDDGGDDEVMVTGENHRSDKDPNEEVCCGVLPANANIFRVPRLQQNQAGALGRDYWPKTKLEVRREIGPDTKIDLLDRGGIKCGYVEYRTAAALCPLLDGQHQNKVRLKAWLDTHTRAKSEYPGQAVSKLLKLSLIVYCPRGKTEILGRWLSQRQLFLSSPQHAGVNPGREVYNPHDIRHVHGSSATIGGQRHPQGTQPVEQVARTVEEMKRDASSMFDNLVKHEDLPEMEPSSGLILTPLLGHQKQALHFLTDHEKLHDDANVDSPNFTLWKPKVTNKGQQVWSHVITGERVPKKPEPVLGGILADMMGLGKTLSILSLIAETRRDARAFAAKAPPPELKCSARATLIICPKSVMSNWSEQIRAHTKQDKLPFYVYHGSNRKDDLEELADYSIVLTTYNTAASEFSVKGKPLAAINWFRIVLDEAHQIRNQNTQVSKACCGLAAERRWAVTGTPVQNGLGDLGALIKFLRIKPFDEGVHWATHIISPFRQGNTDTIAHLRLLVDSVTLRRMKDRIDLKERREYTERLEFSLKDKKVYEKMSNESGRQLTMMTGGSKTGALKGKAYAHVLKSIGRLRMFSAHGLDMFNDEDRKEISEGINPDNAIAIDLGDEPELEQYQFVTEKQAYETLHLMGDSDADRCATCNRKIGEKKSQIDEEGALELADDNDEESSTEEDGDDTIGYLNPCYHLICPKCKDNYESKSHTAMTADGRHQCPCCEAYIRFGLYDYHRSTLRDFIEARTANVKAKRNGRGPRNYETTYDGPSAKVQALIAELQASAAEYVPDGEPPTRSVVFSGWTTYLDLIEIALEDNGIGYGRLDGTMSVRQRTAVLDRFKSDPEITVILVSIKAGGQGLNLTAANKVYMMEPQFNPGVEQQAIDRVHRLGQKREVKIVHYIMADSVEEGILKLQKRKEDLAKFTLERKMSKADEAKKRIEELKDLFK